MKGTTSSHLASSQLAEVHPQGWDWKLNQMGRLEAFPFAHQISEEIQRENKLVSGGLWASCRRENARSNSQKSLLKCSMMMPKCSEIVKPIQSRHAEVADGCRDWYPLKDEDACPMRLEHGH